MAEVHNARVPRSRSVHTVDVSPSRACPRSESVLHFPRAKSIAQIEASPNYSTFRDFTWRRPRKSHSDPDGIPPEKLSQEAFRLLRIIQSLLNTREPDLAQRLNSACNESFTTSSRESAMDPLPNSASQRNSAASSDFNFSEETESVLELSYTFNRKLGIRDKRLSSSVVSCSSPVQNSYATLHDSLDTSSIHSNSFKVSHPTEYKNTALTSGLESAFAGGYSKPQGSPAISQTNSDKDLETNILGAGYTSCNSTIKQQLSEDESGFSSMSSFQEVGIPLVSPSVQSTGCYQEIGLPMLDHNSSTDTVLSGTNHRRWNSSPVDTQTQFPRQNRSFCLPGESLRVLWV